MALLEYVLLFAGLLVAWALYRFIRVKGVAPAPSAPAWQSTIDDALGAYRTRFNMDPISLEALANTKCLDESYLTHDEREAMSKYLVEKNKPRRLTGFYGGVPYNRIGRWRISGPLNA